MDIITHRLLGIDHPEPKKYQVISVDQTIALGISSVVPKEEKTHNLINNEDAAAVVQIPELEITLAMVADSHDGYVASHEAVKLFPEFLLKTGIKQADTEEQIKQKYVDALILLSDTLPNIISSSKIIYERKNVHPIGDHSSTTFMSVLKIASNYYYLGTGDSFFARIRDNQLKIGASGRNFIGSNDGLSIKLIENNPEYKRLEKMIEDQANRNGYDYDAPGIKELSIQRNVMYSMKLPSTYTLDYVAQILPVRKLDVQTGDTLLLCTDGYDLRQKIICTEIKPLQELTIELVKQYPQPEQALKELFETILDRKKLSSQYKGASVDDNVAAILLRIN